ncbi:transglutaminase family protein [Azospirillum sp.]|uniref:transglutaminase-like domain-containing protein n=1 Tax=Azospirillum sp. TaxID=34012 RepID=UPI002D6A260E|nr:transglutaminase family protein [Azospirillum sp.]HYF89090.1 transglutaminase family protein [Azospirillum sp.]
MDTAARLYLAPAEYVDSDDPAVQAFARDSAGDAATPVETARRLYTAVRDGIRYNPYVDYGDPATYRASAVLVAGDGYCVGKAALYAAAARSVGLPARLGFADVRNHLATRRLLEAVGTDVFAWHGYVEVLLQGRWVKVTPTFNASLCAKLGVEALEFDGVADALLQPTDSAGRQFMEYLADHGLFHDVPAHFLIGEMARLYPKLCGGTGGDMEREAETERTDPRGG